MTKRAGKRKFRMGSQRHPPGKINGPDTIEGPDHLKPSVSLGLEVKALTEGWLVGSEYAHKRQKLVERLIDKGLAEDTPADQIARIVNTVSRAEVQAVRTLLAAEKAKKDTKPVVIVQQNNGQEDKLSNLISQMTDEEAKAFWKQHGRKLRLQSSVSSGVGEQPTVEGGGQESMPS